MPDRDAREPSIAEAEWRVIAAECRLLLAMRERAVSDDDTGPACIGRLIDDLAQAAARLRAVSGPSARGRDAPEPGEGANANPNKARTLAGQNNGSFMKPLQIGAR